MTRSLKISKDNHSDSTVISNIFIDEYMEDANDTQLKVYLYLLRMFQEGKSTSVANIAEKFSHTEKNVLRALKYWEKNGLLALEFDENKDLVGLSLRDVYPNSSRQASIIELPIIKQTASAPQAAPATVPVTEPQAPAVPVKPTYTKDQIAAYRNDQDFSELVFIAENYLGKQLTASDMQTLIFFVDELHFSNDLIDYLIQYCVERGHKSFRYIEKVAMGWASEGIETVDQAKESSSKYQKHVYSIMNALGKSSSPNKLELAYISKWTDEYAFDLEIIIEACERTVMATDKHRFEYAEGILSSWQKEGVKHAGDIAALDESFRKTRVSNTSKPKTAPSTNRFNQFAQTTYDFDQLEKELISN